MKTVKKIICAKVGYVEELSKEDFDLLCSAVAVRRNAQAPYSKFWVGVAIRSEYCKIYSGCNVERASWTQTTHAEQNAIDSMVAAEGPVKLRELALVAAPAGMDIDFWRAKENQENISVNDVVVPCGHCLQIIWENCFNDETVRLISRLADGRVSITTIGDALPMKFGPKELGIDYAKVSK